MKLPRDVEGLHLVKALKVLGYEATRQTGSHIRVTTMRDGENHEAIPSHHPLKVGTLASILKHIASHHNLTVEDLVKLLGL